MSTAGSPSSCITRALCLKQADPQTCWVLSFAVNTLNSDQKARRQAVLPESSAEWQKPGALAADSAGRRWQTDLCLDPGAALSGPGLGMSCWLKPRQLPRLGMCLVQEHPLVALPDPLPARILLARAPCRVPRGFVWWEKAESPVVVSAGVMAQVGLRKFPASGILY